MRARLASRPSGAQVKASAPLVVAAFAILLAACGTANSESGSSPTHTLPDGVGSEFQREILADGRISQSEYERAFDGFVSCVQDEGVVVLGPTPMMNGRYLSYAIRDTADSDDIGESCDETYLSFVTEVWAIQQTPVGAEAERARVAYMECLQVAGIDLQDSATYEEIDTAAGEHLQNDSAVSCLERYSTTSFLLPDHS